MSVVASGFLFSLSLIVVIGAQNAFVLRQGLLGRHVPAVVGICVLSDVVLMALGIAGVGAAIQAVPGLFVLITIAGALFLVTYGVMAARRALRPQSIVIDEQHLQVPLVATAATAVALTWLNPHVYLDTLVLLGSVANSHETGKWWFGMGAMVGSALWFISLGFGARRLRPLFDKPRAWQVLDGGIAVVMVVVAAGLVVRL